MKRIFICLIIACLLTSSIVYAETYSPNLNMTIQEFIANYNAIPTPLDSPLSALTQPYTWTIFNGNNVAWLIPGKLNVKILLISSDKEVGKRVTAGVDTIQIYSDKSDLLALIAITKRCVDLFTEDLIGIKLSSYFVAEVLSYYFENNCEKNDMSSYCSIDADQEYFLKFFKSDSDYYFEIGKGIN